MNVNDLIITSLETITAFDTATGNYKFTLDELQNATIGQTEETVDITGKGNRLLSRMKRNKQVTVSGTNGMISGGLLEQQTGGTFENKATEVMWTDYLTVNNNAAATTWKAIGTAGAEISALYVQATDGTLGTQLSQAAEAASGKFAYNPSTKALTFSGLANGTSIVVYYKRRITADVLDNMSDNYATKCALYIDAIAEDKCANVYHVQFYFPKADFNGEFSIEIGGDQAVHAFEATSLAGACGTAGQLWTYCIFGENTEDAA